MRFAFLCYVSLSMLIPPIEVIEGVVKVVGTTALYGPKEADTMVGAARTSILRVKTQPPEFQLLTPEGVSPPDYLSQAKKEDWQYWTNQQGSVVKNTFVEDSAQLNTHNEIRDKARKVKTEMGLNPRPRKTSARKLIRWKKSQNQIDAVKAINKEYKNIADLPGETLITGNRVQFALVNQQQVINAKTGVVSTVYDVMNPPARSLAEKRVTDKLIAEKRLLANQMMERQIAEKQINKRRAQLLDTQVKIDPSALESRKRPT